MASAADDALGCVGSHGATRPKCLADFRFEAPGVKVAIFRVDWLHCVDLGIAADWLGEFLVYVLPELLGRSDAARISVVWRRVQALHRRFPCDSKIEYAATHDTDTENEVLWCRVSWPRVSGAPTRRRSFRSSRRDGPQCESASRVATTVCPSTRLLARSVWRRKFCALKVALEARRPGIFRVKPKLHFFHDLCEHDEGGGPAAHWTYGEEDCGGSMVAMARRRERAFR